MNRFSILSEGPHRPPALESKYTYHSFHDHHGPKASVSGVFTTADKSLYAFCEIYRFNSAGGKKINTIKTFLILL